MSFLESRINSIAAIAIDASVSKADTASPIFYGSVSINKIPEQPNNNFICNIPSSFNSAVSIIDNLTVFGNVRFDKHMSINSSLYVEGRSLLNGSSTISSDLYVSGNTYFRSSSIGSYLQIQDFNNTIGSHYYTRITTNTLLDNKLAISDYNSTMNNHFYTEISTNTLLDNKLAISDYNFTTKSLLYKNIDKYFIRQYIGHK